MFAWMKYPRENRAGGWCEQLEDRYLLTTAVPWQQVDIGTTTAALQPADVGAMLTVSGYGQGLGTDNDAGHFTYIPLTGDGEIDAQVAALNSPAGTGLVGLVIRSNLTSYSPEVAVEWTAANTVQFEHRLTPGAWASNTTPYAPTTEPIWLRLVREGQQLSAYESVDGSSWITAGSDTVDLGSSAFIGVFVGGGSATASATATLQNVYVGAVNQPFTTSWLGNTDGGGDQFVQSEIDAMYVMPDGTIYTDSTYDEGAHEAGIYRNGQAIGALQDTHGWGRTGGAAVTSDGTYVYLAMEQAPVYGAGAAYPSAGTNWYAVRRYNLDGSLAPFPGGSGWDGDMLIVSTTNPVTGLAVNNGTLLVSDGGDGTVTAFNTSTMTETVQWSLENAGAITFDSQGTAWVIQNAGGDVTSPAVVHFGVGGELLPGEIDGLGDPVALAMNNAGQLLVTDDGPAKQVFTYSLGSMPQIVGTFGDLGGLYSGTPGAVTPTKFDGLAGVGMDSAGNLYVNTSAHGATIRCFSPAGAQNWELGGLEFVDSADADPASDGTAVYTPFHQYTIDYSQPAGQQWTLTATTVDAVDYPQDPRLVTTDGGLGLSNVAMRRIDGALFMFVSDAVARFMVVYRFVGDIAVPAAMFSRGPTPLIPNSPTSGAWLWVDGNGDGAFQADEFQAMGAEDETRWGESVDINGNLWFASSTNGISEYRVNGLDANGIPQFNALNQSAWPAPSPITELTRVLYDASSDTLYIAGYTAGAPHTGTEWGAAGTTVLRYNNWSTIPSLQWQLALPYAPGGSPSVFVKSLSLVGDRLLAGISYTAQILQFDTNTTTQLGTLYPGPEVAGQSGWFDTTNAISAIQRANGQIIVFAEEVVQSKVIMYELTAPAPTTLSATIAQGVVTLSWTAVTGAVAYDIQRSLDGINFAALASVVRVGVGVGVGVVTGFTDANFASGVAAPYYRVRARTSFGESPYTAGVAATAPVMVVVPTVPVVQATLPVLTAPVTLSNVPKPAAPVVKATPKPVIKPKPVVILLPVLPPPVPKAKKAAPTKSPTKSPTKATTVAQHSK